MTKKQVVLSYPDGYRVFLSKDEEITYQQMAFRLARIDFGRRAVFTRKDFGAGINQELILLLARNNLSDPKTHGRPVEEAMPPGVGRAPEEVPLPGVTPSKVKTRSTSRPSIKAAPTKGAESPKKPREK